MAKFYGIGVGVGSKANVTKAAIDCFQNIDALYVPYGKKEDDVSVAQKIVVDYIPSDLRIEKRHFPMGSNTKEMEDVWKTIANEIVKEVKSGNDIGFITIGDPMVYSTYMYLLKILRDEIEVVTIPGITSFLDIAANCNFPMVEGDDPMVIVPATIGEERIREYLKRENSVVLMKVYRNYKEVVKIIEEEGLLPHAIAVSNSSKDIQQVHFPVNEAPVDNTPYFTTILINRNLDY